MAEGAVRLRQDESCWALIDHHRVVGFASFGAARDGDVPSKVGELYAINLDADVWGRALAKALLRAATERLHELGYAEALLWVIPDNQRARRVYESQDGAPTTSGATRRSAPSCVGMRYRRLLVEPSVQPASPSD